MKPLLQFIGTGDIQAYAFKPFSKILPDGMNSRLANILAVFDVIRDQCWRRGINKAFINGDVFEKNDLIEVEVYTAVYKKMEELKRAGILVVVNLGNHDITLHTPDRTIHLLSPFNRIVHMVETPTLVWDHLMVIPWMSPASIISTISNVEVDKPTILALHCGVQGVVTGPTRYLVRNPIKLRDLHRKRFKLILLSDYHTSQWLADNVLYMGSPLQHNFGEVHKPAIWEVSLYEKKAEAKPIYTKFPRFIRLKVRSVRDLRRHLGNLRGNYARIEIDSGAEVSLETHIERLSEKHGFNYQIQRNHEERIQSEIVKSLVPEQFIKKYVKGQSSGKSSMKRLIQLGRELYKGQS